MEIKATVGGCRVNDPATQGRDAGNGYAALCLSMPLVAETHRWWQRDAGVTQRGEARVNPGTVGKAKASCLGIGSPAGARDNRSVAEMSETHPCQMAVGTSVPTVVWLASWRDRIP